MDIFIYAIIFVIGTFFGSFFTLAVYRIPKKEDILIKHSYCPNCNHKLGFFDLFPIFSYVFLWGKCRYCKQKIRPRYLILEILSGLVFLIFVLCAKVDFFTIHEVINIAFLLIYISILFIIAGIDKEIINVEKSVLTCGYFIEILYMIYLYILDGVNVYQYVIYILLLLILSIILNNYIQKYFIKNIFLLFFMIIALGIEKTILTIILSSVLILIYIKFMKNDKEKIPMAFCLSVVNILIVIMFNILNNYII